MVVGSNSLGQLGVGAVVKSSVPLFVKDNNGSNLYNIDKISLGYQHSVLLKSDGKALSIGRNDRGQLGDGTTTDRTAPVEIKNSEGSAFGDLLEIAAGESHTVLLRSDGTVCP